MFWSKSGLVSGQRSRCYDDWLLHHLQSPGAAAGYLSAILAESDPDGEFLTALLVTAIANVVTAQEAAGTLAAEDAAAVAGLQGQLEQLGAASIYALVALLRAIGLALVIVPEGSVGDDLVEDIQSADRAAQ